MPVTVGDLLEEAQRASWDLALGITDPVANHRDERDRHLAAWGQLAAAGARALRVVPDVDRNTYRDVLLTLDQLAGLKPTARPPHPGLLRTRDLLAASADLLDVRRSDVAASTGRDRAALRDRLGAVLEAAARATVIHDEATSPTSRSRARAGFGSYRAGLDNLIVQLRAVTTTMPGQRGSTLTDLVAARDSDSGSAAALEQWERAALGALHVETAGVATRSVQAIAVDAALIAHVSARAFTAAAGGGEVLAWAADEVRAGLDDEARAWVRASQSWTGLRGGGQVGEELALASRTLRAAVSDQFRTGGGWKPSGELGATTDAGALASFGRRGAQVLNRVAAVQHATVRAMVGEGVVVIAAQTAVRDVRPVPVELARSARRGAWVPLAVEWPRARQIVDAAAAVEQRARTARGLSDATVRPPAMRPRPDVRTPPAQTGSRRSRSQDRFPDLAPER